MEVKNHLEAKTSPKPIKSKLCKTCTRCGETKPTTEFSKQASKRDGLQQYCKACNKIAYDKQRAENPEKERARKAAWRVANPERHKAGVAKWHAANRDRHNATVAACYAANPEKKKASAAKWQAAHPEARRIINQNRRARKRANGGKLSQGLAERLFKLQRGKCACCHVSIADGNHLDHVIPVALEGPNEDWNMQLLCGPCNQSKGAKHPVDFMQQRGFLL